MRHIHCAAMMLVAALLVTGCGSNHLKTKGRIVKNGATFVPEKTEVLRVVFVPMKEGGKDEYAAQFTDPAGGFQVAGKDLRGMPPGKYRAAIEYRGSRPFFDGKLDSENSPFVFDVDAKTTEIVIDLDHPPAVQ
jgi:hypothetical protein